MPLIQGAEVRKQGVSFEILFRFFSIYSYDDLTSSPSLAPAYSRPTCKIFILEAVKFDVFYLQHPRSLLTLVDWLGSMEALNYFGPFILALVRFGDAGSIFQLLLLRIRSSFVIALNYLDLSFQHSEIWRCRFDLPAFTAVDQEFQILSASLGSFVIADL